MHVASQHARPIIYILGFNALISCLDISKETLITRLWVARTAAETNLDVPFFVNFVREITVFQCSVCSEEGKTLSIFELVG